MKFLRIYQYVAPLAFLPAAYWLWWRWSGHDHRLVILALSIPILFAYVIPGLGTNWLRLWEINTRWRLGKFRPHHGFVFGTASSMFAVLCLEPEASGPLALVVVRAAVVLGSVLAFWNWIYDIHAVRTGFIIVYSRARSEGRGPEAIATEYAPVLFGVFGACYGASIRLGQHVLVDLGRPDWFWGLLAICAAAALVLPVLAFAGKSYLQSGEFGLRPHGGP